MTPLPSGTVTFLFTDVEGSTRRWEQHPTAMDRAIARHDAILKRSIEEHRGAVFKTVGDAFCASFSTAPQALRAALSAQRALAAEAWDDECAIRVRMAVHTGAAVERDGDYFGPPVNRVARLLSAGHGGQILLSGAAQELVRDVLPPRVDLRDLGEHRLKDLARPERIFQAVAPDLGSDFPPLKVLDRRPHNLPVQPTPLIGRQREVRAVCDLLRQDGVRLVTLTGPGGTGKTRLALQVAAELLDELPDGAYVVSLASIADPDLVLPAVAATLGLAEAGEGLVDTLTASLRDMRLLLVLDNVEHLMPAAPAVGEILAACPDLKVLATSREALRLAAEREFPVPPLAVPEPKRLPSLEALSQYDAVALFIQRARGVKPDFTVTNETAPAVAEICHRLDGLPLAIELAATRIRLFPPPALLGRLDRRLKILTGGARDLPARQQTLRGAIDWSYSLLDAGEQALFARLAVFAGGCTVEAAEAVCAADGPETDILEGVSSLVEKSLLKAGEDVSGGHAEPRFAMLETIREYAAERLERSGQAD
ncbi:MAG: adenylate/guanylate cyclase domain-containing protein, partial [Chloroflexi bacterium]|nr:adenylate/guanylate cyclase domain-containing protein [Chloroflexota bacterium]